MNVLDWIRERILKFLKIEHLPNNPTGDRLNFISNDDEIKQSKIKQGKIWYVGDESELLNYYTNQNAEGFADNPIYNRNTKNWFWALSAKECGIKRVHDNLAHDIIDTLVNVIGNFTAKSPDEGVSEALKAIIEENDLQVLVNQQEMPYTLAEGFGAFKMTMDKDMSDMPIIEYYQAENVRFIYKRKRLVGVVFIDYYKDDKGDDYVLLETRRIVNKSSRIEYALFKIKANDLQPVELDAISDTKGLPKEGYQIDGLNDVLATPCVYFHDANNPEYGRPLLDGKFGLLDDLDQIRSQASQTVRVSTPVEYYDAESMRFTKDGIPMPPTAFNRQFIAKEPMRDGDGNVGGKSIETTQPRLDFNSYDVAAEAVRNAILTGVLSPATMGIDVSRKDNADAQREKEKITIMTRNNIIARQTSIIKDLLTKCLMLKEYIDTDAITLRDYQIDVAYNEFANPSFESELQLLAAALQSRSISPEMFVEKLYGSSLSDEEKARELEYVKKQFEMQDAAMEAQMMGTEEEMM